MQLTNEEAIKLVKKLQPHISGFSRSFQIDGIQGKEVVCGGKVSRVVDMSKWSDHDEADIVYVTIDDGIGELLILVPRILWKEAAAGKGEIIIANGQLFALSRDCMFKSKAGTDILVSHGNEPFRVLVKSIHKLQEEDV